MSLTDEQLVKLSALAAQNGIDLGVQGEVIEPPSIPPISIGQNLRKLAGQIGEQVADRGIYLHNDRVVTVGPHGECQPMDPDDFRSWVEEHVVLYKGSLKDLRRVTMNRATAEGVLKARIFKAQLPVIHAVHRRRLPVLDGEKVRRLEPGYDREAKVYTMSGAPDYPLNMDIDDAVGTLRDFYREFRFADEGRSLAVQVAAMVGLYVRAFFPEELTAPMIFYNANLPGSGKSLLAMVAISVCEGPFQAMDFSKSEEFKKELDSRAALGVPYIFLDDVGGFVDSKILNRWLTQPRWSFRPFRKNDTVTTVPKKCLSLFTGNQARLSHDLARRSLTVDLWTAELADERAIENPITEAWLEDPSRHSELMAALWALVRYWNENGRLQGRSMPSFERWSRTVAGIVTCAGFANPIERAQLTDAGDTREAEFRILIEAAVEEWNVGTEPVEKRLGEWAAIARRRGIFFEVISDVDNVRQYLDENPGSRYRETEDSPSRYDLADYEKDRQAACYLDRGMATKWGMILHKFRGRHLVVRGATYRFGTRKSNYSRLDIVRVA